MEMTTTDVKVSEDGVVVVKSLVMSKSVFKQVREVSQNEFVKLEANLHPERVKTYLGYVVETFPGSTGDIQVVWFLFLEKGSLGTETLLRIRESELFWLLRGVMKLDKPTESLRDNLRQVFVK